MLRDILIVGDKIEVKQLDTAGLPINMAKTSTSQLLDIVDDTQISIAMPQRNGILVMLHQEFTYQLCFYSAKGLYQCNCTVVKAYKENNIIIALVRLTSKLDKLQRRQYYRLECILDTEYRIVTSEETSLEQDLEQEKLLNPQRIDEINMKLNAFNQGWQKASITDISGGGARFTSESPLKAEDHIWVKLDITIRNQIKTLEIGSVVISSLKILNQSNKYEHRVEFVEIGDMDREDLIKYIFEQERQRRQKR